jgi:hypothetical protein
MSVGSLPRPNREMGNVGTPHIQYRKEDGKEQRNRGEGALGILIGDPLGMGLGGVAAHPIASGQDARNAPTAM